MNMKYVEDHANFWVFNKSCQAFSTFVSKISNMQNFVDNKCTTKKDLKL